jgi:hypothetical protein
MTGLSDDVAHLRRQFEHYKNEVQNTFLKMGKAIEELERRVEGLEGKGKQSKKGK